MQLYKITQEIEDILAKIDAGEINEEEVSQHLDKLSLEGEKKLDSICSAIKSLEAEAETFKAEAKRLSKHGNACSNRAEGLRSYIGQCLGTGNSWSSGTHKISWRSYPKVSILSELDIPDQFCEFIRTVKKERIEEQLKAGYQVPGAEMDPNIRMLLK